MMALVFELIFFYAFLRTLFEQAFGIVPAVILTALFYAFHHIGFQPEYGKLIFVGVLYATVYRLGNSALLIYPFFLGVGGTYDVLIQSKAVSPILFPEIRTLYLAVLILAALIWTWKKAKV
jgi:membrane protease YdiL (CAAX protease family)